MTNSSHISEGVNCIFCKIIKKEIPATIIHEDGVSLSLLDINPVHEGHVLVIPKEHHASLLETPNHLVEALFVKAKSLIEPIRKGVGADFVVLTVVGTDVPHFHIHLIPRFKNDGLAGFWPATKYESAERMQEIAQKIKNNLP